MKDFGRHAWLRLVTLTRPFFQSELRRRGLLMLGLLVILLFSVSGLNVVNSFVGRDFMTAVAERRADHFGSLALLYLGVFALATLVAGCCRFTEERLGLLWRDWFTRHLLDRYLAGHAARSLSDRPDIDNPDQRIAEDVKTFTVTALSLLLIVLNSTITLCSFAGILWSITPWLFLAALVYAAFGSVATLLLGRRMVGLDVSQLKKEADFRYELVRVRDHPDPAELAGQEAGTLRRRLRDLVDNYRTIVGVNRNLNFFTTGYDYLTQLIPVLIVAPLYMRGAIEFGTVTQAAMAFCHVLGAFSLIVKEFQRITTFAAVVKRLGTFWEATEAPAPAAAEAPLEVEFGPLPGAVAAENV